jgi:hypothetical protein
VATNFLRHLADVAEGGFDGEPPSKDWNDEDTIIFLGKKTVLLGLWGDFFCLILPGRSRKLAA